MKVLFNRHNEFFAEIEQEREAIQDRIMRLCIITEASSQLPGLANVSLLAGVVIRGRVVELREYCGQVYEGDQMPPRVKTVGDILEKKAGELGLEIRAGKFEP